jgi:histone demethylase
MQSLEFAKKHGVQIKFHGRNKNEASHYCGQCEVIYLFIFIHVKLFLNIIYHFILQEEVFNILYIREQEKKHVVHCMSCARKQSPNLQGFICLEEYKLNELTQVYDSFQKAPVQQSISFMPPPQNIQPVS